MSATFRVIMLRFVLARSTSMPLIMLTTVD
jgi:hypothetical protein